jgi:N-acetyl-anhydromuramyl-L-alanine amidase AmpD
MTTTAMHYTKGPRNKPLRLVVIHSMESQEKPGTAVNVAKWFSGPTSPKTSAHVCVDSQSIVTVVEDSDIAWAAPGGNSDGLHIECAGTAAQTREQWLDKYSVGVLDNAAKVAAGWCKKYSIPAVLLTPAQVADGKTKGICGHVTVTKAFPKLGTHTDPGANFPWDVFIDKVKALIA